MRILIAEDDDRLARAVAAGLRRRGMTVDVALTGDDALDRLAASRYDVVVLDRDLPGVPGDDICRTLAAGRSASRILMLTAARSVGDRVEGLGLGADDYLPKPFDFTELVARIQALGRRPGSPPPAGLGHGDLSMDPARRIATRAGRRLALTPKELAVLECLLAADGRPVPAEELLQRVWDEAADPFTTTVKTTIGRLRAKLGDPPVIETVRESGYRIGGS
jgi:DNA-binding response OmpR family regulator